MSKVIGRVCAPTGKYIKDGEEKTSWVTCGIVLQTDKGMRIKLDVIPIGGGSTNGMWFSVFEDDDKKPEPRKAQPSASNDVGEDDDMPFN